MNYIEQEARFCARNYDPLPVVLTRGKGAWVWDVDGRRYIDMMSAYSAVSHGHGHPRILAALAAQARRLAVPSRAYYTDRLGPFLEKLCAVAGLDAALPMNTGAEAVETAIKAARRWAYRVKGVARDRAEIIVAEGNFHGRTTTIVGFSSEPAYRDGFGPFTPGFRSVPFGDVEAMERAITPETAAVLVEPIQGEAGIVVPPAGWLKGLRRLCDQHRVLLILDEIQSGLGRTGAWFAFQHEGILPDGLIVGKALGGGVLPVSAFVARREVIDMFTPGSHGSTFGGNPLAAAVGLEALKIIEDERLVERSKTLGDDMMERLRAIRSPVVKEVRGRGLWAGAVIDPGFANGREFCERLLEKGVLSKETHDSVVRLAPPLIISLEDLDLALSRFEDAVGDIEKLRSGTVSRTVALPSTKEGTEPQPRARILMCPPEHFIVSYSINPWMDPAQWASAKRPLGPKARREWLGLHRSLLGLGAVIELVLPEPGLPDLVFTANAAVVSDGKALLARFRYPERQAEQSPYARAFHDLQGRGLLDSVHQLPDGMVLEGAGDCVWDESRRLFWLGYGPRSDKAAGDIVADLFGTEVVALELADPRFYHMDTALCPLSKGETMYFPGAFTPQGVAEIRERVEPDRRIELDAEDAWKFAANAICFGDDIVLSTCGLRLRRDLEDRGYRVHMTPLGSFQRSGGSAFCLILRLDRRSKIRSALPGEAGEAHPGQQPVYARG